MVESIWDYLNCTANRPDNKTFQLVKHYDEVIEKNKKWPMIGQIKKDGVFCATVVDYRGAKSFSRTGRAFVNTDIVSDCLGILSIPDGIYISELCNNDCSLEVLSGMVNPNRIKELSPEQDVLIEYNYLAVHDYVSLWSFTRGLDPARYGSRYSMLESVLKGTGVDVIESFKFNCEEEMDKALAHAIEDGEEGMVFKQDADWVAGHKGYRSMKLIRGVSYDLEIIDLEFGAEGTKRFGMINKAILRWKNGTKIRVDFGKGWTDDIRINYFIRPADLLGEIVEVTALQESSKGKLRNPKVGQIRIDKSEADV